MSALVTTWQIDETGITVTTTDDETVEIDAAALKEAGWEFRPDGPEDCGRDHCDAGDCPACTACEERDPDDVLEMHRVVEDWHNAEHSSVLRFCEHPVCKAVGSVMGVRHA